MTEPTPETLLAEWQERYPKAFPADGPRPLTLGIHYHLKNAGYDIERVKEALAAYTSRPAYLKALVAEDAARVNLKGKSKGRVSELHREMARHRLENPDAPRPAWPIQLTGQLQAPPKPERKKMATIQLTAVQAKVAFTIDAATFRAVLDVDSTGAKTVPVAIQSGDKTYTAQLNPKSFRKAQAAFREAMNPAVSISGNLKGYTIESAGIQIFDKGAKPATAETEAAKPQGQPVAPALEPQSSSTTTGQGLGRSKLSLKPKG